MEKEYTVNQDTVTEAVRVIGQALESNEIPRLEGMVALKAFLTQCEEEAGFKVGQEKNTN